MVHGRRERLGRARGIGSGVGRIRDTIDTLLGLMHVLVMLTRSGFRLKSPYWAWRTHTAFGSTPPVSLGHRLEALLSYARWARRIRRLGR